MRSDKSAEPLDLQRGLPTTAEDVAVQKRLRGCAVPTPELLEWLARLPAPSFEALRARGGPRGEPFRLVD